MKTYYSLRRSLPMLSISALLALLLASCGSYQNTSNDRNDDTANNGQSTAQSVYYKNYFSTLNEQNEEVITDIDNYSSTAQDSTYTEERSYGGWGSSNENVTVNIYDNSWGYNPWYGVGWGYGGWYRSGWGLSVGWGGWSPWYGYGWGGYWGGYYPYYGVGYYPYYSGYYNNNFYGNNSPNRYYANNWRDGRRYTPAQTGGRGRNYSEGTAPVRNSQSVRNSTTTNRTGTYRTTTTRNSSTRNAPYTPGTRNTPNVRSNSGTRNNNYTPTRNSGVRSQPSSAPTRNYSPGSSGGSRPSGGGGGGRSSGGGGRRG